MPELKDWYYSYDGQAERTQRRGYCLDLINKPELLAALERDWGKLGVKCNVTLLDRKTGKTYAAKTWVAVEGSQVDPYFLYWHYCGCHRIDSIVEGNDFEGCPANRFLVVQATHPEFPEDVLYYEEPIGEYKGDIE